MKRANACRVGAAIDQPPGKALYLLIEAPGRMDANHDHLSLHRDSGAPMRFPISRVGRIVCNRQVNWSGPALSLCLTKGVPITWVDGKGRAIGNTQPRYEEQASAATLIETYIALPEWTERFANWVLCRRHAILTRCVRQAAESGNDAEARTLAALKRSYVYHGNHPVVFNTEGQGGCYALTVEHLHRAELQACYWGFNAVRLNLADELAALLWAELNLECGTLAASTDNRIVSTRLFESWAHQNAGRFLQHLGDLKRHMSREIEAWR